MTKLAEIQEAIRALPAGEQDMLRVWLDEAPLDAEKESQELKAALLKAIRGPHRELEKSDLRSIAERIAQEKRNRRIA